jgi:hypothetical protein
MTPDTPQRPIPTLVLVGGFLGAGKTTLILQAARLLARRGLRSAAVMNDQDAGLVDTKFVAAGGVSAGEVAGGCFCCRFSDLVAVADQLREHDPHVIFAEPVGSCVDLSATLIQPLKAFHGADYRVAPLTVLVDPGMAERVYSDQVDPSIAFLFRKQVAEADLLCATKLDLYPNAPEFPVAVDLRVSARTGDGVESWLAAVLDEGRAAGTRLLEVDYTAYAEAEAALGWLNLEAEVELCDALTPAAFTAPLLAELRRALGEAGVEIAHLKVFDAAGTGYVKAGMCGNHASAATDGDTDAAPAARHELVVNLRAVGDPERLREIVGQSLAGSGAVRVWRFSAFRPAPPRPEHRFTGRV